ncbi:hypothetical protein RJI07_03960 [Mycoplasmatota bacterium WC30]
MRKFKYLHSKKIEKKQLKKRIDLLDPETRKRYKSNQLFSRVFGVLYWSMMVIFLGTMTFLERYIEPTIGKTLFTILVIICTFFLPALFLLYPYFKLAKKYPRQVLEDIPKDVITECNTTLFRFYKIPDNYIITKCYDSSNQNLVDKDLLLFFYKDKLRVVNDFTTTIKDFGCYEFELPEIEITYGKKGELTTAELKSKKLNLSLGKRAKPFIANKGLSKKGLNT